MRIEAVFPSKDFEVLRFGVFALGFHFGPIIVSGLFMLVQTSSMRQELNGRKLDDGAYRENLRILGSANDVGAKMV